MLWSIGSKGPVVACNSYNASLGRRSAENADPEASSRAAVAYSSASLGGTSVVLQHYNYRVLLSL
eukprot:4998415-Amphidinium_carterae.2